MVQLDLQNLLDAGVQFGHRASRWNPKMERFIHGKRNRIHLINLRETVRGLIRAEHFVSKVVEAGRDVIFVGTKRQAKQVLEEAGRQTGMHWVTERWVGGTLTNFHTIRKSLARLEELEALEETGDIEKYSKKMIAGFRREKRRLVRNLEGIRNMEKPPGLMFVVDPRREKNAVREANKLDIPVVALIDTDSDPEAVDIPIPGNDDAMRAIRIAADVIVEAIEMGRKARPITEEAKAGEDGGKGKPQGAAAAPMKPASKRPSPTQGPKRPPQTQAPSEAEGKPKTDAELEAEAKAEAVVSGDDAGPAPKPAGVEAGSTEDKGEDKPGAKKDDAKKADAKKDEAGKADAKKDGAKAETADGDGDGDDKKD